MSLFVRLLDEVTVCANPVSMCLLSAKILAADLPGRKFARWVDAEVRGYDDSQKVPTYRFVPARSAGRFIAPDRATHVHPVAIDVSRLPEADMVKVQRYPVASGVCELEQKLAGTGKAFRVRWEAELINRYPSTHFRGMGDCALAEAWMEFSRDALAKVVYDVRHRLVEFLIELKKKHPELARDDGAAGRIPAEEADRLADTVIYNLGCTVSVSSPSVRAGRDIEVAGPFVVADDVVESFNGGNRP